MKRSMPRTRAFLPGVLLFLAVPAAHAGVISLGEQILNGDFGTNATPSLASWTATPGSIHARPSTDTINTSTGNIGFDGFFTDAFAVIGDSAGVIGTGPQNGTLTLQQSFTLPATIDLQSVISYSLAVSFKAAFDGWDTDTGIASVDFFSAGLGVNLISWNSNADLASTANFSHTLSDLAPGLYTISYTLIESTDIDTNSAAGVDKVSVFATALVQDARTSQQIELPEPGVFALLGIGMLGIGFARRKLAR